ncbi:threonine--tRNA ligase [Microlunatus elymi]|uniref:Threonine--tRNA ligase n=1 Tax=Microlunatus elymi TaxID=2596828 RepID=A0A516Q056_9ACTN|nr:threonine--tRNA ligase [Microlunatus elymi]QDP96816.1 threonine--tRNA ligase [Microlunatus elymi]
MNAEELSPSDHRVIGRQMEIFATDPQIGSGLPLWRPAGAVIRHELEQFARELAVRTGCQEVYSPVLAKRELYERSGHWAKFSEDMFPPLDVGGDQADGDQLVLRPANCPHHALIYAAEQHSYRDLPVRYNELAPMFRAERSGVLSGLSRVRQINLDDTHVFCRSDQVADEVSLALNGILHAFDVLGIKINYLRLSRRDAGDGYLGSDQQWRHAEDQLRAALAAGAVEQSELEIHEAVGEAAFYGPKIDVQVSDTRGHEESLATVQLDFNQPERFGLAYVAADRTRQPVIMIHRGVLGAMERMVAFLLELHDGRLPLWLAPVQIVLLPVHLGSDDQVRGVAERLRRRGIRVRIDVDGSLGRRIRASRVRRDALIGVIGQTEIDQDQLAIDDPRSGRRVRMGVDAVAELVAASISSRAHEVAWPERFDGQDLAPTG